MFLLVLIFSLFYSFECRHVLEEIRVRPKRENVLNDYAFARCLLHSRDWASVATISVQSKIRGYPFSNIKSMADGPKGEPYFYISDWDETAKDMQRNPRATVTVSLEQTLDCSQNQLDIQGYNCPRLMITGKLKKIEPNNEEYESAKAILFERHPKFTSYPSDHGWQVVKLKIEQILLSASYKGIQNIPVRTYLKHKLDENTCFTINNINKRSRAATT